MGIKQSSTLSAVTSNDLFGEIVSGCLAGLGIWTKPSENTTETKSVSVLPTSRPLNGNNVYPLRVTREKGSNPKLAGRMVISGRMADVCAELDRLAA